MPDPNARIVILSDAEQQGLEKLVKRHTVGQQLALRGRIILLAAAGNKNTEIAKELKVTLDTVRLWRGRWLDLQSIALDDLSVEERLQDLPRPGAPGRITADQRCQIEALACEEPEESGRPITHWTAREIADEIIQRRIVDHISPRHAARLFKRGRDSATSDPLLADTGA
ncbi:MAG TPA: helix-turn-helix domain-containing protein [Pyrinomonadaceae bacterium]|nr:helix-turn-helix domain-containing protein [Pyrinomonadaceae bacterium]